MDATSKALSYILGIEVMSDAIWEYSVNGGRNTLIFTDEENEKLKAALEVLTKKKKGLGNPGKECDIPYECKNCFVTGCRQKGE